ncbi:MAG: UDP-glucose 4-epimerase [Hyphomicrobiaceae bacterium]|jgi:UDP-glucose 4-epimerase
MKTLVTGGAGFIGSHIAEAYLAAGHEVFVLDDLSSGKRENLTEGATLEVADLRSPEAAAFVKAVRPDVVCHHAAQMNVRRSVEDPMFDADVNVLGLLNVVEAARAVGTKRVIFASSGGTVYGDPANVPPAESEPLNPLCPYGVSKVAGEIYLGYYARIHGLHSVILRYGNVYGPRQDPRGEAGVISIFAQRLLANQQCTIYGDGRQTRDYVFVGDVARANVAALTTSQSGAFNISTGIETDVVELFEKIQTLVGVGPKAVHADALAGEVRRSVLACGRASKQLGWEPTTALASGLDATIEWFRGRS